MMWYYVRLHSLNKKINSTQYRFSLITARSRNWQDQPIWKNKEFTEKSIYAFDYGLLKRLFYILWPSCQLEQILVLFS